MFFSRPSVQAKKIFLDRVNKYFFDQSHQRKVFLTSTGDPNMPQLPPTQNHSAATKPLHAMYLLAFRTMRTHTNAVPPSR